MQTVWDETLHLEFINEISPTGSTTQASSCLCRPGDNRGGESKINTQTIRALLGPTLKSISLLEVGQFETHERFGLARDAISDALQKSPKIVCHQFSILQSVRN